MLMIYKYLLTFSPDGTAFPHVQCSHVQISDYCDICKRQMKTSWFIAPAIGGRTECFSWYVM